MSRQFTNAQELSDWLDSQGNSSDSDIDYSFVAKAKSISNLPAANEFGVGIILVEDIGKLYKCDGINYYIAEAKNPCKRLITVGIGNSIAAANKIDNLSGALRYQNEQFLTSALLGGGLDFPETGAFGYMGGVTSWMDAHGWYGHGGKTSSQMLAEIDSEFFNKLKKAGVSPDFIWFHSLFENDYDNANNLTVAESLSNLDAYIATAQALWPKVISLVAKHRPTASINITGANRAKIPVLNAALNAYDDGDNVLVYDPGAEYADSSDPTFPRYITATGSISGTTLTIESVNGVIDRADGICLTPGTGVVTYVTNIGTTQGGPGVYTINNGDALSAAAGSTLYIYQHVDTQVHPSAKSNMLTAKAAANKIAQRFGRHFFHENLVVSANLNLTGSAAATGTDVVGGSTLPTGVTAGTREFTGSAITYTALGQGFRIKVEHPTMSGGVPQHSGTLTLNNGAAGINLATLGFPAADAFEMFVKLKIIQGGQWIHRFSISSRTYRATQDAATELTLFSSGQSGYNALSPADGIELTLTSPIIRCVGHGANYITALGSYISMFLTSATPTDAVIEVEIMQQGLQLIQDDSEVATLVAGTVTVSDTRIRQTSKVKVFRRNSAGTVGDVAESARVAGTSITISSSNAADTSAVGYEIL
ncbi:MAG: hypothetical protein M0R47_18945 [Methylobacter sp.]|uniref:hypothetical protein n=1 Tax=Methylobacter sp. TaxID=2051955 RepID=UPI0025DB899A|nr:hypothetical protein [Methylobacter sp.]MCK9622599.1 hypothetical protein [Methylobacter sp.]